MTPTETAAKLRVFNDWRRGELDDLSMPDPREIGEAIDAAVEMIERLEAAEKAVTEAYQRGYETGQEEVEKERDALREQQEINLSDPVVQKRLAAQWGYVPAGAQPAPSVPEGWQLVPTAESGHLGIYKMLGALHAADNTPGMSERESYRAMLSEAPEVKP